MRSWIWAIVVGATLCVLAASPGEVKAQRVYGGVSYYPSYTYGYSPYYSGYRYARPYYSGYRYPYYSSYSSYPSSVIVYGHPFGGAGSSLSIGYGSGDHWTGRGWGADGYIRR